MYTVVLTKKFIATHSLDTLRPQPHEHEWIVKVTLAAPVLQDPGIVMNYYELKPLVNKLLPHHQNLNEVYDFAPTGENLARYFYDCLKPQLSQLQSVSVGEFEEFMCTYSETID